MCQPEYDIKLNAFIEFGKYLRRQSCQQSVTYSKNAIGVKKASKKRAILLM